MALQTGQTYTLSGEIPTGIAPGGSEYKAPAGSQLKIKDTRTVGGQLYYDIDQTAFGGGTGWTLASALEGAIGQVAPALQAPRTQEEVTPYLNQFQGELFKAQERPEVKVETMEELGAKLKPGVGLPPLIKRAEERERMRVELGVAGLETSLTDIKAQIDEEYAALRQQREAQRGKGMPLNVVAGRIGELERTAQERIDFLGRQQARITDELNTKYTVIGQYMQDIGLDYGDAVARYDTEFKNNVTMYNIITGKEEAALTQYERDRTAARSNLQIYTNAITAGNLTYADMSSDQKLMVTKLEVQSGLPIGFISNLNMSAKDRLLSVNDKTGEALMIDANGNFNVVQTGMRPTPTTGAGEGKATDQDYKDALVEDVRASQTLDSLMRFYGTYLDPKEILRIYDTNSPYGTHTETDDEITRKYGIEF